VDRRKAAAVELLAYPVAQVVGHMIEKRAVRQVFHEMLTELAKTADNLCCLLKQAA
jgi:hypothetical protein